MKIEDGPFKGYELSLAPQTELGKYSAEEIDRLLDYIGHPEALVTDQSLIGDFGLDLIELEMLSLRLGFPVSGYDTLSDVLQKMRHHVQKPPQDSHHR